MNYFTKNEIIPYFYSQKEQKKVGEELKDSFVGFGDSVQSTACFTVSAVNCNFL